MNKVVYNKTITESTNPYDRTYPEKQRNYLKKIIGLLVSGSKLIQKVDGTFISTDDIDIPAVSFTSSYGMTIYHKFLWELRNHLERIYGLTNEESEYVWSKYQQKMVVYDNRINSYLLIPSLFHDKNLNESKEPKFNYTTFDFENIDKKFLDKVVEVLKNETTYNPRHMNLTIPIRPYNLNNLRAYDHSLTGNKHSAKPYPSFYEDMKDKFGIGNHVEIMYIYRQYKKFILELIPPFH
jgi:hypothetical protein